MIRHLEIVTSGQGLWELTEALKDCVGEAGVKEGLVTLFVQHTSASLVVQENADPSARRDLEEWLNRLVVEGDRIFTHTLEGPDDMPAHIKAALTATSLAIPVSGGRPMLGTWQGVFLWEHRKQGSVRKVAVHLSSD
ncbi:MAG: secondary thiamine-phosphate synthase enzyme YjbQ [Myxococcota bacterium]|nr:secondary thiamine-phosphate synthase enzyme YjbQ [Myxococcota bacterium]